MSTTVIEWATHVWNPFTGCDRVSPGCANCYAAVVAEGNQRRELGRARKAELLGKPLPMLRYQNDGDPKTSGPGFAFTVHEDRIEKPPHFADGARVFVNSMSDVFHEEASDLDIARLFGACGARPWASFLILTKRADRMVGLLNDPNFEATAKRASGQCGLGWPFANVWLGVSIENHRFVSRADLLRETPAAVRFISAEPLLGPLVPGSFYVHGPRCAICKLRSPIYDYARRPVCFSCVDVAERKWPMLDLAGIDWLIVGGESGDGHRRIDPAWVRDLRDACESHRRFGRPRTAFFFKQWGGQRAKSGGRELDGRTWDEFPYEATAVPA